MPKYDKNGKVKTVVDTTKIKFHPSVFDRYLEHCKQGGSIPEFCRLEGISRKCFDVWIENFDAKKEIKAKGKLWAEGWWMNQAKNHLVIIDDKETKTKFDTNLYRYYTGGRFGHNSEKDLLDVVRMMQEKIDKLTLLAMQNTGAYAELAECEPDNTTE